MTNSIVTKPAVISVVVILDVDNWLTFLFSCAKMVGKRPRTGNHARHPQPDDRAKKYSFTILAKLKKCGFVVDLVMLLLQAAAAAEIIFATTRPSIINNA